MSCKKCKKTKCIDCEFIDFKLAWYSLEKNRNIALVRQLKQERLKRLHNKKIIHQTFLFDNNKIIGYKNYYEI
jgi:hypothetical protein